MKTRTRLMCAFILALAVVGLHTVTNTATAQDQPTIQKDSIQITAFTVNSYKGNFD